MPALIDAADFRGRFDISNDITDARINPHIGSASRRLRRWVGDANYDLAIAGSNTDLTEDLKNAEAHLAFHYAIFGFNAPLSPKGVLVTASSTEAKEVRRYLNPTETAELAGHFLELAREIAEQYMTYDGTPDAPFGSVAFDETAGEASTRNYGGDCC